MNNSEIAHRRLRNQGLSKTMFKDAVDVVTQLGAVQAQDYSGAKWALGQRLKDSSDSELDQAFADGSILRTHLLRPTWHFVTPTDIRWLLLLTAPRVHTASAFMYRQSGLDKTVFRKSNATLQKALQGGKQLTRKELASALAQSNIPAEGFRLGYLMMYAELEGIICSGARRGKQFTYALLEERVPPTKALNREEALAEITMRYFSTRGPASLQDFTWWSGLKLADAKNGIEMVKSEFVSEEINGRTRWFIDSKLPARKKSPTAYLLPNYDEYFIGFKDRSAIGEVARRAGVEGNDPALLGHIVILDGQVVGGWRRTLNKDSVTVEINLIVKLTKAEEEAVHNAAERFGNFIELPLKLIIQESNHEKRKTRSF
jgi:hypothetical protein